MISITEFIATRKLRMSKEEENRFRGACSYIARQGAEIRSVKDNQYHYDEGALCLIYNESVVKGTAYKICFNKLFSKRKTSSTKELLLQPLRCEANLTESAEFRMRPKTKIVYYPGIIVKIWRWFFGYREEVEA